MSSTKSMSLDSYASLATLPVMAAAGGFGVMVDTLHADIVYQDLSLTIGTGSSTSLSILGGGEFTVAVSGSNFQITNSSADKMRVLNRVSSSKGYGGVDLERFDEGEKISLGSSSKGKTRNFAKSGAGDAFATSGEGPESGYVGFGIAREAGLNYGWIALEWDGSNLTIDGYAYEDAGGIINAGTIPAPGAIGLLGLAAGAAGLRRKRQG